MRFHVLARYLAAILASLILAACGGGGGSSPAQPVQTTPPLAYPIPANLWVPPAGAVPASGSYIYLQSDSGDYIGAGRTYLYTNANALINLSTNGLAINIGVHGNERWSGSFLLPAAAGNLQAGYFSGLTRAPFADQAIGGIEWGGEGRGCNMLTGWLAIDKLTLNAGVVTAIDLRFEQHCEGGAAALRGQVHWVASDPSNVAGPVNPPPAGLWSPTGFVAPAGNYVYLVSDSGDYIGGGRTELLTSANTTISVDGHLTAALQISAGGWYGNFVGMNTLSQLAPGYYGGLQRYPFHNPLRGGLDWSGNGRGCNKLTGWFVVDKATYSLGELLAIDLRFEQHCEGGAPALHGMIHWVKP
jgi:hypothetical protein